MHGTRINRITADFTGRMLLIIFFHCRATVCGRFIKQECISDLQIRLSDIR